VKADVEAFRDAHRRTLQQSTERLSRAVTLEQQAREMKRGAARTALRQQALSLRRSAKCRPGLKGGEVGINRFLARLRHVCSWAIEEGYIPESPFKRGDQTVVKMAKGENPRKRRLKPGEEERLWAQAGDHLRALIVAALSTGCRLGELLSATWEQISFD